MEKRIKSSSEVSVYSYEVSVCSCKVRVQYYKVSVYSYTDLRRNKATAGRAVPFKKFVTENAHLGRVVFSRNNL